VRELFRGRIGGGDDGRERRKWIHSGFASILHRPTIRSEHHCITLLSILVLLFPSFFPSFFPSSPLPPPTLSLSSTSPPLPYPLLPLTPFPSSLGLGRLG